MDDPGDTADGLSSLEVDSLGHHTLACPYLRDKVATFHFVESYGAARRYHALMKGGFRRSGRYFYRPQCAQCDACKVLRVPIKTFQPSKSQRKIQRKGLARFEVSVGMPAYTPEKAAVYKAYLAYQHGSEEPVDQEAYQDFLVASVAPVKTIELQIRDAGRLAGLGILDFGKAYLSSVYFFFHPEYAAYSLGTFSALCEIDIARALNCTHYYLGYYIADCPAMAYKARFMPCEWKGPDSDTWHRMERQGGERSA